MTDGAELIHRGSDLPGTDLVITFVTPCVDESFFDPVKKGAMDAAAMLDVSCHFLGTEDVDIDEQISIVHRELASGCRAFALSIVHPTAYSDLLDELWAARTPVVAFNVNASNDRRLTQVCQDVAAAGKTLGALLAPSILPGSHLVVTYHSEGISALTDRRDGVMEELEPRNVTADTLITGTDSSVAADRVRDYLVKHPDIRTIICTGLADTEGSGLAIESFSSSEDYLLAGFDLSSDILRLVKSGIVTCTIDQQPYVQGFYPVIQLVHQLRYGIRPTNIDAGAMVIDRDNVDSVIEQSRFGYR